MGKTNINKWSLKESETLAEIVKKYQCLYNKSFPGCKVKLRCKNAWKAVDDEINLINSLN